MDRHHEKHWLWRAAIAIRRLFLVACAVSLVATFAAALAGCGEGSGAAGTVDETAAHHVQEYFEGDGARYVGGVSVENVQVTDEFRGRTLSVDFVGDGSDLADASFSSLYYQSISDTGWTAELNDAGLGLAWVRMTFDYGDGLPDKLEVDIARNGIGGSTRLRPGPVTTLLPMTTEAP